MMCSVCKTKPVIIRGASTCSLNCATIWDNLCAAKQGRESDSFEMIEKRLITATSGKLKIVTIADQHVFASKKEKQFNIWKAANPGLFK